MILLFFAPLVLGNLFQQLYSMADTLIVGRFVGVGALAVVKHGGRDAAKDDDDIKIGVLQDVRRGVHPGQGVSGLLCLVYIWKKVPLLHLGREDLGWDREEQRRLALMGIPMALQFSITAVGTIIIQAAVNALGSGTGPPTRTPRPSWQGGRSPAPGGSCSPAPGWPRPAGW